MHTFVLRSFLYKQPNEFIKLTISFIRRRSLMYPYLNRFITSEVDIRRYKQVFHLRRRETLILCSAWRMPNKQNVTRWTHCLPTRYTVPQFENHDRWKVNRFFQCLTQNDRAQTSTNVDLCAGSYTLLPWSEDWSAGRSRSDTCLIDARTITLTGGLQRLLRIPAVCVCLRACD